jgi:hypothetical protein
LLTITITCGWINAAFSLLSSPAVASKIFNVLFKITIAEQNELKNSLKIDSLYFFSFNYLFPSFSDALYTNTNSVILDDNYASSDFTDGNDDSNSISSDEINNKNYKLLSNSVNYHLLILFMKNPNCFSSSSSFLDFQLRECNFIFWCCILFTFFIFSLLIN